MEEEQETKVEEVKRMIKRGMKKKEVREVIEKLEEVEREKEEMRRKLALQVAAIQDEEMEEDQKATGGQKKQRRKYQAPSRGECMHEIQWRG